MKKLLTISPGSTTTMLVFTKSKSSVSRAPKSFSPHYGEFLVFPRPGEKQWTSFVTHLKDGSTHVYYYRAPGWDTFAFDAASICNGNQNVTYSRKFGGEFYNPRVRPLLVSKDVPPT